MNLKKKKKEKKTYLIRDYIPSISTLRVVDVSYLKMLIELNPEGGDYSWRCGELVQKESAERWTNKENQILLQLHSFNYIYLSIPTFQILTLFIIK